MLDIMRIIWLKTLLSGLCSAAWLCPWHLSTTVPVHLQGWNALFIKECWNVDFVDFSRKDGRGFSALRLFVRKAAFQARARAAPLVSAGAGKHQQNPIFSDKKNKLPNLRTGWSGPKCKQCKPRKGCKYGSCSKVSKSQLFFYWLQIFYFNCINFSAWGVYLRWRLGR